jgi:hypothetical protein
MVITCEDVWLFWARLCYFSCLKRSQSSRPRFSKSPLSCYEMSIFVTLRVPVDSHHKDSSLCISHCKFLYFKMWFAKILKTPYIYTVSFLYAMF